MCRSTRLRRSNRTRSSPSLAGRSRRAFAPPLLAVLAGAVWGCEERDPVGPLGDSIPAIVEDLSVVVGSPGETVEVRVRVLAASGTPVEGIGVRFEPVSGGGGAQPELGVTDGKGIATTGWTLGEPVGVQRLAARVSAFEAVRVEIDAEVFGVPVPFHHVTAGPAGVSCGLDPDGRAFCWGRGDSGQQGGGGLVDRATPGPVAGAERFVRISAGATHACAVAGAGAAFCWGDNEDGRLGTGGQPRETAPRPVAGGIGFASVSAGETHTCGLTPEGVAYCWGSGDGGRLGTGTESGAPVPTAVAGGLRFASLAAGLRHTCGLTVEGEAHCWGEEGPWLGTDPEASHLVPGPVVGGLVFSSISAGEAHTCAVSSDDARAYCWGEGSGGRLGTGSHDDEPLAEPTPVQGGLRFLRVAAAGDFTCGLAVLDAPGVGNPSAQAAPGEGVEPAPAWCWGRGERGQLGNGGSGSDHEARGPVPVSDAPLFVGIAAGGGAGGSGHACAVTVESEVYCWGSGGEGQLGTGGSGPDYLEPEPVRLWSEAGG
jgi:alpha-tubulin suppressor-like RCC1 family protein